MAQQPQSFKNHAKFDPKFHFFLAPVSLALVIWMIVNAIRQPNWGSALCVGLAIWALVAIFTIRTYSLKVQDRVIRLEERVRLKDLLPASIVGQLSIDQLIGLRFASDGEVAELAQKALAGNWNRKQIKEAIKNWRPDNWRV
ncbi:MAG TPA: DUF6526 family protein [Bryobacteraceae bacterium]|jgi:hypothetical protein